MIFFNVNIYIMSNACSTHRDNSGILTSIFGPAIWEGSSCITFNYPNEPTDEDKHNYKTYFESLPYVVPCETCREHLKEHLFINENTKLTDIVLQNRSNLTYWWYNLHNAVNKMLGINYDITYEDYCKKYESYIATCKLSSDEKALVYKNYYNKEAPYISYENAIQFSDYAKKRGFENFDIIQKYDKFSNNWIHRNEECWKTIKKMRLSGVECLEKEGKYEGFPTIDELHLIQLRCTTMTMKTINKVMDKLKSIS